MADNLASILASLGDTPDEIAAYLAGQGIKGWRMCISACPVANYVARVTGKTTVADTIYIETWDPPENDPRPSHFDPKIANIASFGIDPDGNDPTAPISVSGYVLTPETVKDFMIKFDNGKYPYLETII